MIEKIFHIQEVSRKYEFEWNDIRKANERLELEIARADAENYEIKHVLDETKISNDVLQIEKTQQCTINNGFSKLESLASNVCEFLKTQENKPFDMSILEKVETQQKEICKLTEANMQLSFSIEEIQNKSCIQLQSSNDQKSLDNCLNSLNTKIDCFYNDIFGKFKKAEFFLDDVQEKFDREKNQLLHENRLLKNDLGEQYQLKEDLLILVNENHLEISELKSSKLIEKMNENGRLLVNSKTMSCGEVYKNAVSKS